MWVKGSKPENAVILCNPNGGFYEFAYYQTEWLDYYNSLGLNVFLWNYRSYGRSGGKANLQKIKKDGEVIVNYIRTEKRVKVLGIHGESLGGCVAVYLAKECVLDFLIADRTFSSLSAVALFKFGKIAYWLFRLFRGDNSENVSDYIDTKCFKILMADPNDMMIDDLSSLKSAVALQIISAGSNIIELGYLKPSTQLNLSYIISPSALAICGDSLYRLKQFSKCLSENKPYQNSEYFKRDNYERVKLETDTFQEENISNCVDHFFIVINKINAGGKRLSNTVEGRHHKLSLIIWMMALDIWGSSIKASEDRLSCHMKALNTIKRCLQEIQSIQEKHEKSESIIVKQVFKDVNIVFNILIELMGHLEERCGISSDLDETMNRIQPDYQKAGLLIPLQCGHSGILNPMEKHAFTRHLSKFLSESN